MTGGYERLVLRVDSLRPYAAAGVLRGRAWPGRAGAKVPLLMYPATVYFGRLVQLVIEQAPGVLHGRVAAECDMSDVLRGLAVAGHGVAWLPSCSVPAGLVSGGLEPVDDGRWGIEVATVALRDRAVRRPALDRVWARLVECSV